MDESRPLALKRSASVRVKRYVSTTLTYLYKLYIVRVLLCRTPTKRQPRRTIGTWCVVHSLIMCHHIHMYTSICTYIIHVRYSHVAHSDIVVI